MCGLHNGLLDPQGLYGQTLLRSDQSGSDLKKNYRYIEFVTTSGAFNLNFPKNHDFDDLGKAIMKIPNFMCSNGPGRWVGAQRCLELDLKFPKSILSSKSVQQYSYRDMNLINTLAGQWPINMIDTHETYQSPQKSVSLSMRSWFNKFWAHIHDT